MSVGSIRRLKASDPASPWVFEYTDPDTGKRVRKTPASGKKKDAEALRAKIASELFNRTHVRDSGTITIKELVAEYLGHMERRLKERRGVGKAYLVNVTQALRVAVVPIIGDILVRDVAFRDVERVALAMGDKGRSPRTIRMRLQTLSMAIDFAVRRGYAKSNIVPKVLKERGADEKVPIRQFGLPEIDALIKTADSKSEKGRQLQHARMRLFVHLAITMGLRWGEIAALTIPVLDFRAGTLAVKHSLTRHGELKPPKTKAGIRKLSLPSQVVELLEEWLAAYYEPNDAQLLFRPPEAMAGKRSNRVTIENFHREWHRLLARAGLDKDPQLGDFHFHALRHFHSSFLAYKGVPVTDIAEMMGHKHFDVTLQVYAHPLTPERQRGSQMQTIANEILAARAITHAPAP